MIRTIGIKITSLFSGKLLSALKAGDGIWAE